MNKRLLGTSGLEVAPLMFGANVFGWTLDERASFSILDACVEAGINFIDTADVYSAWAPGLQGGESETIIGKWFRTNGKRDQIVLATKVGFLATRRGLAAKNIQIAVEDSLRRLQTDYIDVYFSHTDDQEIPLDETLGAYRKLIDAGKVRMIGASNYCADRLQQACEVARQHGLPQYQVLQPEYNLYDRCAYESQLEPIVQAQDMAVVTYYGLARGFLTGKYRTSADTQQRARGAGIAKYLNPRGLRIIDALVAVAEKHGTTPAAVALAWIMARPSVTAPIASATSIEQLQSLVQAMHLALAPEDIHALDHASAPAETVQAP